MDQSRVLCFVLAIKIDDLNSVITHSQLRFKFFVSGSLSAMAAVNQDLKNISKWCAKNSLLINPEKTKLANQWLLAQHNLLKGYLISPYSC